MKQQRVQGEGGISVAGEGMGGQGNDYLIFLHWFSPPCSHTNTHILLSLSFQCDHSSLWGSCCQFLPRLIIALLASICNGPILSNPEHWACALAILKITLLIPFPSLSICPPSLPLSLGLFSQPFHALQSFPHWYPLPFPTVGFTRHHAVQSSAPVGNPPPGQFFAFFAFWLAPQQICALVKSEHHFKAENSKQQG